MIATLSRKPVVAEESEIRIFPEAAHFYIPSLDGIRALAVMLVFVAHAGLGRIVPGGFGVTIFFFLSGYLITTLMRREAERSGSLSLKSFYARRALRIFPPLYIVLISSYLLMAVLTPTEIRLTAILGHLFQLSNYSMVFFGTNGIPPGMVVTWSLSVEEHFYLLFPLFYLFLRKRMSLRGQAAMLLGLCSVILAWRCVLVYGLGVGESWTYNATDARVDSILFGCVLALYGNPVLDSPGYGLGVGGHWGRLALVGAAIAAILATLTIRNPQFRETFRYSIQGLAMIPIFDTAIRFPRWPLISILNLRWVRFLGVLSYSFYLLHFNFLILLNERTSLSRLSAGLLALTISLVLAYAIFRLVELPCARLRKRLATADRSPGRAPGRDRERAVACGR